MPALKSPHPESAALAEQDVAPPSTLYMLASFDSFSSLVTMGKRQQTRSNFALVCAVRTAVAVIDLHIDGLTTRRAVLHTLQTIPSQCIVYRSMFPKRASEQAAARVGMFAHALLILHRKTGMKRSSRERARLFLYGEFCGVAACVE